MKKFNFIQLTKKLFIHLIVWMVIFVLADFCCCFIYYSKYNLSIKGTTFSYISHYVDSFKINEKIYIKKILDQQYREPENIFSPKGALLLLGCSYTYGFNLNKNETFSHRLAELTGRPVYNRAFPSYGFQQALIQFQDEKIKKLNPEYVFYLYIDDHINRFDHLYISLDMYSKIKDGSFVYTKIPLLKRTYIYMVVRQYLHDRNQYLFSCKNAEKYKELMLFYFVAMRSEVEAHWGENTKFIILTYDIPEYQKSIFEELETDGFTIIKLNELLDIENPNKIHCLEYRISERDIHPNARLWEELTPKLVEKLNLY